MIDVYCLFQNSLELMPKEVYSSRNIIQHSLFFRLAIFVTSPRKLQETSHKKRLKFCFFYYNLCDLRPNAGREYYDDYQ